MGQHRTINEKTHRVNRNPNLTEKRVLRFLQEPQPQQQWHITVISASGGGLHTGRSPCDISEIENGLYSTWERCVHDLS